MLAAQQGSRDIVSSLLSAGAPWNALDKSGRSAGEYAVEGGHIDLYERLIDAGCRAELLLSVTSERPPPNDDYLKQKVVSPRYAGILRFCTPMYHRHLLLNFEFDAHICLVFLLSRKLPHCMLSCNQLCPVEIRG